MRIAVAGATGRIGRLTTAAPEAAAHQTVPVSRGAGIDLYTGEGLAGALAGADAVIDVLNNPSGDRAQIVDFLGTSTRHLLEAEEQAAVGHHVLLSIVGLDHDTRAAHYAGKREQERLVTAGPMPWSIVRATQFHDLAAMVAGWTEHDEEALPLRVAVRLQHRVGVDRGRPPGAPMAPRAWRAESADGG